jgi:hypothetical protein
MWAEAAKIVQDLANRTPEFKDRLLLLDGLMGPQSVLPIGFGYARRVHRYQVVIQDRAASILINFI